MNRRSFFKAAASVTGAIGLASVARSFAEAACPAGQDQCDGYCADLKRDPNNCGRCGRVCENGRCLKGKCSACPVGTIACPNNTCAEVCPETGG